MRAGRLKHWLFIDRPVVTKDPASGAEVPGWQQVARVRAAIEPIRGRESTTGIQTLADVDTLIVFRWAQPLAAITARWRCRFVAASGSTTIYNIASPPVHVKLGHRELQLMCKSGVNEG